MRAGLRVRVSVYMYVSLFIIVHARGLVLEIAHASVCVSMCTC